MKHQKIQHPKSKIQNFQNFKKYIKMPPGPGTGPGPGPGGIFVYLCRFLYFCVYLCIYVYICVYLCIFGFWILDFGYRIFDLGFLDVGFWIWDFGFIEILDVLCNLRIFCCNICPVYRICNFIIYFVGAILPTTTR